MRSIVLFLCLVCLGQAARAEPVDAGYAVVELVSERKSVAPGDRFLGALKLTMDDGWHVYWKNAGDAGVAPDIQWTDPAGARTGAFIWPAPETIPLQTLMNYGYSRSVVLPFEIVAPSDLSPGGTLTMKGRAEYQICKDICVWESADLALGLPVAAAPESDPGHAKDIAGALMTSPVPIAGEAAVRRDGDTIRLSVSDPAVAEAFSAAASVRFYPEGHEILHFPEQSARRGPAGGLVLLEASTMADADIARLAGVLVVDERGGTRKAFAIDAAPGDALPGTDDEALGAGGSAEGGVTAGRLATWLLFGFLGGLILNLMPCVLPVLTIKANSVLRAAHEGDGHLRAHGLAYAAGVIACFAVIGGVLLALRGAGEAAGLGFQLQYPPMVLALAVVMTLVGLNLLGLFTIGSGVMGAGSGLAGKSGLAGPFFTGALAAVVGAPCVGPLLAASLGAVMTQPAWTVMVFMIVMALGFAAPFALLPFFPGLARRLPRPGPWMTTLKKALAVPMFLTAAWLVWVFAGQVGVAPRMGGGAEVTADADGMGEAWSPERVAALRAEGRPVFVDFTARWCVTCQVNKQVALKSDSVRRAMERHGVVFLTADWTQRNDIIGRALREHGRAGVPLYLLYPAGGGDPVILPQLLTAGLVVKEIERIAGE